MNSIDKIKKLNPFMFYPFLRSLSNGKTYINEFRAILVHLEDGLLVEFIDRYVWHFVDGKCYVGLKGEVLVEYIKEYSICKSIHK